MTYDVVELLSQALRSVRSDLSESKNYRDSKLESMNDYKQSYERYCKQVEKLEAKEADLVEAIKKLGIV